MANYENENWNRERNRGFDRGDYERDRESTWDNPERRGWSDRSRGVRPDERYGANEERYNRNYGSRSNWGGRQDRGWGRGEEGWRAREGWDRGEEGWDRGDESRGNRMWLRGDEQQDWNRGHLSREEGMDRGYGGRETYGRRSGGYNIRSDFSPQGSFQPQGSFGSMENYGTRGNYGWQTGYGGGLGSYGGGTTEYGPSTGSYMGGMGSYTGERGRHAGRGPKGWHRSDERIREDINERLTDHPDIDASDIEVQVKDGEVTLSGTTDDRHSKRLAEDIAERVSGVKDVHNQIRVQQHEMAHVSGQRGQTSGQTGATAQSKK